MHMPSQTQGEDPTLEIQHKSKHRKLARAIYGHKPSAICQSNLRKQIPTPTPSSQPTTVIFLNNSLLTSPLPSTERKEKEVKKTQRKSDRQVRQLNLIRFGPFSTPGVKTKS